MAEFIMLAKTRTINVYVPRRVGRETLRINETSVTVTKTEGDEFSQSGPCLVDNGQLSSSFSVSHPRALFFFGTRALSLFLPPSAQFSGRSFPPFQWTAGSKEIDRRGDSFELPHKKQTRDFVAE